MIAVIGDIHGCYNSFRALLDEVDKVFPGIKIYAIGDLVDRGNFSYEVVNYLMKENIPFTLGNHDHMFYSYIKNPNSEMGKNWHFNGSETTLLSYSTHIQEIPKHISFIGKAPIFLNLDECFISHAGISVYYESRLPDDHLHHIDELEILLKENLESEHGILWTRERLMDIGKLQLVGHTRHSSVYYQKNSNAIYIDTSVYTGNKLSAVIVDDNVLIRTISINTLPEDLG
jgi:Calcineurin-like phosphoesterase